MANRTTELFTIGYEKRSLPEFVQMLKTDNIEAVADLRANPYSRKKGFSKKTLSAELESMNIKYVHFVELGAPREIRDRVRFDGDYDSFFISYEKYLKTQAIPLDSLLDLSTVRRTCLLCYELDPNFCHRKIVAEKLRWLSGDMMEIHHLM